jgi:zinc D-Ala-D-Ala dipeptidase
VAEDTTMHPFPNAVLALLLLAAQPAQAQTPLPSGFVDAAAVVNGLVVDMRYFGHNNFVGERIDGYDHPRCLLSAPAANALAAVERDLAARGLGLKVFDCYRPQRAVADMVAWSRDGKETAAGRRYNPVFRKQDLFRLGYIAEHSGHSTGAALDLTLVDLTADNSAAFDPSKAYGDCTAPAEARAPEGSIDMGTGYDCSDVKAHTATNLITTAQRRSRNTLVAAMARQGFANYSKEWWHFSLPGAGRQAYDFPITPRK